MCISRNSTHPHLLKIGDGPPPPSTFILQRDSDDWKADASYFASVFHNHRHILKSSAPPLHCKTIAWWLFLCIRTPLYLPWNTDLCLVRRGRLGGSVLLSPKARGRLMMIMLRSNPSTFVVRPLWESQGYNIKRTTRYLSLN